MPFWLEIEVLLLLTYATGVALGWLLWGRAPRKPHIGE